MGIFSDYGPPVVVKPARRKHNRKGSKRDPRR
jgi:hypothetical protein